MGPAPCRHPTPTPHRERDQSNDDSWITVDGRPFFVAGYTAGGAPYGCFTDEFPPDEPPPAPSRDDDEFGQPVQCRRADSPAPASRTWS